jgi:hypothetical protein
MNELEQECIILNSAWEMIDGMVNWAMFVKHDRTEPTNVLFETSQHSRLFTILLGDFLSQLRAFKGSPIPLGLRAAPSGARPLISHSFTTCGKYVRNHTSRREPRT